MPSDDCSTGRKVPSGMFGCGRCGKFWGGMNTCHCSGCCRTFSGITALDAHRRGGKCADPEALGLEQTARNYECFGYPSTGQSWRESK